MSFWLTFCAFVFQIGTRALDKETSDFGDGFRRRLSLIRSSSLTNGEVDKGAAASLSTIKRVVDRMAYDRSTYDPALHRSVDGDDHPLMDMPWQPLPEIRTLVSTRDVCNTTMHNFALVDGKPLLIVAATTAPNQGAWRNELRQIYQRTNANDVALFFPMGKVSDQKIMQDIQDEANTYGDIMQGDFMDTYENLAMKTVFAMRSSRKFCPDAQFFLKHDTDAAINYVLLKACLRSKLQDTKNETPTNAIYGCKIYRMPLVDSKNHKNYQDLQAFPLEHFYVYESGPSYIIGHDALEKMSHLQVPFQYTRNEDAQTGMLAHYAEIPVIDIEGFFPFGYKHKVDSWLQLKCEDVIMLHAVFANNKEREMWYYHFNKICDENALNPAAIASDEDTRKKFTQDRMAELNTTPPKPKEVLETTLTEWMSTKGFDLITARTK